MNKHFAALALVAAASLLVAAPASVAASTSKPHTLAGWVVTNDSYADPTAPAGDPLAPACAAGALWRYNAVGHGEFSHLGDVDYSMTHCTYGTVFAGDPPMPVAGTFAQGRIVIVADNGDELYLSHSGEFHIVITASGPVSVVDPMTWTITGGTGRFQNATGSGTTKGLGDILNNTTSATWSGTIIYTASDRSDR
jgi:hypothetical protein